MMERKTIWRCKFKIRVWKEVYSNKTKSTKLSHLYNDYSVDRLLKGNCPNDLIDQELNSYAYNQLKSKHQGKYSCKIKVIGDIERVSQHGLTNNKYPKKPI